MRYENYRWPIYYYGNYYELFWNNINNNINYLPCSFIPKLQLRYYYSNYLQDIGNEMHDHLI